MKKFGFKKKVSKRISVIVASVLITTTLGSIANVVAESNATPYSQIVGNILGDIKSFGIVAEEVVVDADCESNIATNKLTGNTHTTGNTINGKTNLGGIIYAKEITNTLKLRKAVSYVIVGDEKSTNYILKDDAPSVNVVVNADYLDVTKAISNVASNMEQYEELNNTSGSTVNLSDMNNAKIDVTKCASQICVVSIDAAEYGRVQLGGLKITKNENQVLIINVANINTNNLYVGRYNINGNTSANDNLNYSNSIIWNFGSYEGKLSIGEGCGIFVATKANVDLFGTSRGRVIANKFTVSGNEWHFLSQDVEDETTTEETSSEETITEDETTTKEVTTEETSEEETSEDITTTEETSEDITTTEEETSEDETTTEETTSEEEITTPAIPLDSTSEKVTKTIDDETTTIKETTPEEETTTIKETTTEEKTTEEETTTVKETTTEEEITTPAIPLDFTSEKATKNIDDETTTVKETTTVEEATTTTEDTTTEDTTTEDTTTENVTTTVEETTTEEEFEEISTDPLPLDKESEKNPTKSVDPEVTTVEQPTDEEFEEIIEIEIPLDGPQTGDSSNVILYVAGIIASMGMVLVVTKKNKVVNDEK